MLNRRQNHTTWADKVLAVIFGFIIIVMITQVIFRYAFNHSLFWSEEIVRYLFVWMVFLGGALVLHDRDHISVEFFIQHLPERLARILDKINLLFVIFLSLFFIIGGFLWVFKIKGSHSPALGLPINWLLYGALPVTSILSLIFGIEWFIDSKKKDHKSEDRRIVL